MVVCQYFKNVRLFSTRRTVRYSNELGEIMDPASLKVFKSQQGSSLIGMMLVSVSCCHPEFWS